MDKAAYSVRNNAQENDCPTFQVELWGNAANVPRYSDEWYQGVADLCQVFVDEYGIPPDFADFTNVRYGAYAPQRMSDEDVTAFSGFLGHCHMGYGVDTHWDPGELDAAKVLSYMTEPEEPMDVYIELTAGWVRGLDEDHDKTRQEFTRLNTEVQSDGNYILEPANDPATVEYFMAHLGDPYWSEWPGFRARTELSVWGR
jgi:hypothetical protein